MCGESPPGPRSSHDGEDADPGDEEYDEDSNELELMDAPLSRIFRTDARSCKKGANETRNTWYQEQVCQVNLG